MGHCLRAQEPHAAVTPAIQITLPQHCHRTDSPEQPGMASNTSQPGGILVVHLAVDSTATPLTQFRRWDAGQPLRRGIVARIPQAQRGKHQIGQRHIQRPAPQPGQSLPQKDEPQVGVDQLPAGRTGKKGAENRPQSRI